MQKFIRVTGTAAPFVKDEHRHRCHHPGRSAWSAISAMNSAHSRSRPIAIWPTGSDNPDFVLNQPRYRGAQILLSGENFGCGSSRESAVWALAGFGFRCIIAASFGDIFTTMLSRTGMLLIRLPKEQVERLVDGTDEQCHAGHDGRSANADRHRAVRCA